MAFPWRADDGPLLVLFGSFFSSSKNHVHCHSSTLSGKTFWIRAYNNRWVKQHALPSCVRYLNECIFSSGSGKICHDDIRSFDYCGTSANCPRAKVCDPVLGVCCRERISDGIVSKGAGTLVVDTTSGRHSVLDTGLTGGSTRIESSWSSKRHGEQISSQHTVLGHHRPTSETPFEWRFADGPMVARFFRFTGKLKHCIALTKLMQNISQFARSSICMGDNPLAQIVDYGLSPQTDEQNKHVYRINTTSAIFGFR